MEERQIYGPPRPKSAPSPVDAATGPSAAVEFQFGLADFPAAAAYFDQEGERREANRAWFELLGLTADGDDYWLSYVHPEDAARLADQSTKTGAVDTTVRWLSPLGGTRWLRVRGTAIRGDEPVGGIWTLDDVTDQVMSLGECARLDLVAARLADYGDERSNIGHASAVLLVGLDGLGEIGFDHGETAGDLVTRTTWARLRTAMRGGDYVSQIAADEFLVSCSGLTAVVEALGIAERLIADLQSGLVLRGKPVSLGIRIGIAGTEATDADLDDLLQRAATARSTIDTTGIALAPDAPTVPASAAEASDADTLSTF